MPDDADQDRRAEEREDAPAPPVDQQGSPSAEHQDWNGAKRIVAFVAAIVMVCASVWLGGRALGYAGPLFVGLGMFLGALILLGAGLALTAMGLLGVRTRRGQGESGDPVEQEAERRGMPTDPEAYQDGGVGVAATALWIAQAELIASELNTCGIPAWVDQSYASTVLSHVQLRREGIRVLVPLGRLADARRVVAERGERGDTPGEAEEPAPRRSLRRTGAAILLLCNGLGMVVFAIIFACGADTYGPSLAEVAALVLMGLLGFGALAAGILGLRTKPKPKD